MAAAGMRVGILLCTEAMSPERARGLGREGVHLLAVPRATGGDQRWPVAVRMAGVVSGGYALSSTLAGPGSPGSGVVFRGRAVAASPEGELLAEMSDAVRFATVVIEPAMAEAAKRTSQRTVRVEGR